MPAERQAIYEAGILRALVGGEWVYIPLDSRVRLEPTVACRREAGTYRGILRYVIAPGEEVNLRRIEEAIHRAMVAEGYTPKLQWSGRRPGSRGTRLRIVIQSRSGVLRMFALEPREFSVRPEPAPCTSPKKS